MKQTLTALLLLIIIQSKAQVTLFSFPQPGLEQVEIYHGDWTTGGFPFNNSFRYLRDTTVGGNVFAKFSPNHLSNELYTYYDSGKVYYYFNGTTLTNPTTGKLIYDFSLNIGDTISLNSYSHYGNYTVDSVSSVQLLNGQIRKFLRLFSSTDTLKWIDGIGDIEHGLIYEGDFEGGYEEFVCHKDSTGNVYLKPSTNYNCNSNNPAPNSGIGTCGVFSYSYTISGTTCSGSCNGSISITGISGGSPPYTFLWNTAPAQTGNTVYGCCQGSYAVTITDASGNNCSTSFYVPITPFNIAFITINNVSCNSGCDGSATIIANGGSAPYMYSWTPGGEFTSTINNLCGGIYSVCVTEMQGCQVCATVVINEPMSLHATVQTTPASCTTCCDGDIQISPIGGVAPFTYSFSPYSSGINFCPGNYYFCITDGNGCSYCDSAIVSSPLNIQNNKNISGLSVYPNPVKEELTIFCKEKIERVEIYNPLGSLQSTSYKNKIYTSNLPSGIYFIKIYLENGTNITRKFIKD